jgi:predicted nucleotidyltransferase
MSYPIELFMKIEESKKADSEYLRITTLEETKAVLEKVLPDFNVDEVIITGSLLVPYRFNNRSDIDIAVSGLRNEDYFTFISRLEELLLRNIEIIEFENCRFLDKIKTTGLKIK